MRRLLAPHLAAMRRRSAALPPWSLFSCLCLLRADESINTATQWVSRRGEMVSDVVVRFAAPGWNPHQLLTGAAARAHIRPIHARHVDTSSASWNTVRSQEFYEADGCSLSCPATDNAVDLCKLGLLPRMFPDWAGLGYSDHQRLFRVTLLRRTLLLTHYRAKEQEGRATFPRGVGLMRTIAPSIATATGHNQHTFPSSLE
ncbi:hypothetical protein P171DRAFT_113986 [Karstenula rhodostoma CBS 690.94]|uniref:Uncharacterized protein n=1 Tax=Karstenula rhodostoma CBS 690.94 TaxID=1392251 RepID=A0A9P4U688_9PLEO|nr:hypothetical protein P171DRAFT_113986 [Karstenula rhodostoma CBS 690.94]